MKPIISTPLKHIAPLLAVGLGVLLAAKPEAFFASEPARTAPPLEQRAEQNPVVQNHAPTAQVRASAQETPAYVAELRAMIEALRTEVAALKNQEIDNPHQVLPDGPMGELPMYVPGEDPNILAQKVLAIQQQSQDARLNFTHRYSAAAVDSAWTQRLQASIGSLESEIVDTELAGVAFSSLECRDVGCEIRVTAKDIPADIVSLMLEAQLGDQEYVQSVTRSDADQFEVLVAKRS